MFIKKETKELGVDIIENCQNWKQGTHTFGNGKLDIWTANTPLFDMDSYPKTNMFNIFERLFMHRCIKKSKIKKAINKKNKLC